MLLRIKIQWTARLFQKDSYFRTKYSNIKSKSDVFLDLLYPYNIVKVFLRRAQSPQMAAMGAGIDNCLQAAILGGKRL